MSTSDMVATVPEDSTRVGDLEPERKSTEDRNTTALLSLKVPAGAKAGDLLEVDAEAGILFAKVPDGMSVSATFWDREKPPS